MQMIEASANETARDYILTALFDLLGKSSFEKISVSQIVQRAGISRSTFYLHFRDKYDLLEQVTNHVTDLFLSYYRHDHKDALTSDPYRNVEQTTLDICTHILNYQNYYKERFQNPIFIQMLARKLSEHLLAVYHHKAYAMFAGYGTIGYLQQWVQDGCRLSPSEAANELTRIGLTNWSEYSYEQMHKTSS